MELHAFKPLATAHYHLCSTCQPGGVTDTCGRGVYFSPKVCIGSANFMEARLVKTGRVSVTSVRTLGKFIKAGRGSIAFVPALLSLSRLYNDIRSRFETGFVTFTTPGAPHVI